LKKMVLHLVSDLNKALVIKAQIKCPHIHFHIEEECGAFNTSILWMEVLTRASAICIKEGSCVVSYNDPSRHKDTLSDEDIKFLQKMQVHLSEKMNGIEVVNK